MNRNGSQDGPPGTDPPNRAHTEPQAPGPTERGPNRAANVWCAECDERLESQRNPYSKKPDTWPGSARTWLDAKRDTRELTGTLYLAISAISEPLSFITEMASGIAASQLRKDSLIAEAA